jgi:hypothetical protein
MCVRLRSVVIKKVRSGSGADRVTASTATDRTGEYTLPHTNGGARSFYAVAQGKTINQGINQTRCTKARSTTKTVGR